MASFMSNFFPGGKDKGPGESSPRPATPIDIKNNNSFVNPTSTPQGSPSKKTQPPGAYDLPSQFDNAMSLNPNSSAIEAPLRLTRPQSVITPLSPTRTNVQPLDETSANVDDSVVHKGTSPGGPLKKHGQENLPPTTRTGNTDSPIQHNHAAVTRQQLYEPRERTHGPAKKFNTLRGLTPEEKEILNKPQVKRLVNVTQLCKPPMLSQHFFLISLTGIRLSRLLLRPSYICWR